MRGAEQEEHDELLQSPLRLLSSPLVILDNHELLLRRRAGEDNLRVVENEIPALLGHVDRDGMAGDDDGAGTVGVFPVGVSRGASVLLIVELHVAPGLGPEDSNALRDGLSSDGVVACDHDDLDPCGFALGHGWRDSGSGRVDESHEAQEDQSDAGVWVLSALGVLSMGKKANSY